MAEINLLQNRLKDTTNLGQRQNRLVITVLSAILVVLVGITAVIFFLNKSLADQTITATSTNQDLTKQLNDQQSKLGNAKSFQAQLANLRFLLNGHTYVSPLLDELSRVTYARSQFISLDVTQVGKIHLEGRVDSYTDLGKLILGLSTSPKFSQIKLLSAVPSTGSINGYIFSIDMNVTPDIFLKK
ncbi:MAG: PilN domain-containing protein [Candidatus Doudnabacteria bacterium]